MENQIPSELCNGETSGFLMLVYLVVVIVMIVAWWKVFTKAGQPGWASIIPGYNLYVLCVIASKPGWWLILFFIPVVNIVISLLVSLGISKNFGKGTGFGIGLWLLSFIFYPILGFGSATHSASGPAEPAAA